MRSVAVAVLLMVLFAVSFALPSASCYHSGPNPSDDESYNQFGPVTSNLRIIPYVDQEAAYEAFKVEDIDFMDSALTVSQIEELNVIDPNMTTYGRAPFTYRGIREIDINNKKFPTNDIQFRKALAHCFDKNEFVTTNVTNRATAMDSPIAYTADWNNPYCSGLYPYNLSTAESILNSAGYTDQDSDGWREGPTGQEIMLDFYIRQDDPDRTAMGLLFAENLESISIKVNAQIITRSICFQKVMGEFDFHLYTGGWAVTAGVGPLVFDFSELYCSDFAQTSPFASNYVGYSNPAFDSHIEKLLNASEMGDPSTSCTAKYHLYECQKILMDDAAIIPVFTYASYGGYVAAWENIVNEEGCGPWSWFTMLNTYKQDEETINWGVADDIKSLNVMVPNIGSGDWRILDKIYDKLLKIDPYDMASYEPWMATNWTVGEWTYEGQPATWIEFKLREDMYWHDISPKADRQTPSGSPLLVNGAYVEKVMADDVVFTIQALKGTPDAPYGQLVTDVVSTDEIDPYTIRIYYSVHMPLWALLWVGDIPIIPKHVWEPMFLDGDILDFDPLSQECLSGCGPWTFDYANSSTPNYYSLHENTRYFKYHLDEDDIAVFGVVSSRGIVAQSSTVQVNAIVANRGEHDENFNIMAYANTTMISMLQNIALTSQTINTVTFSWDTTNVAFGNYILKACAGSVPNETNTSNNNATGGCVTVTIPGDLNGDFKVTLADLVLLAKAYGSVPGDVKWNPNADINGNDVADLADLVILAQHYGQHYP